MMVFVRKVAWLLVGTVGIVAMALRSAEVVIERWVVSHASRPVTS